MPATTDVVLRTLESLPELRPFPAVASQLLAETENPESSAADLTRLIRADPVIAVRLLKLANSSLFGFPGEIRSIDHAIVILGRRQLCNFAVSLAAGDMFASGSTSQTSRMVLWHHSIGCAAVARTIAENVRGAAADEAFLAGIMHDVGKLVFFDILSDEYHSATSDVPSSSILKVERQEYGITHQEVGQRCADEWGLPYEINEAISNHHLDGAAELPSQVSAIVAAANVLAKKWSLGATAEADTDVQDHLQRCSLDLQYDHLPDLQVEAIKEYNALRDVCSV
jgi:putative nucleotidyltransferase with HDIG domain